MASDATLDRLLADHRAAVTEFVDRALSVAPGRWDAPRSAGKWTPGQEVKHIVLAYDAFVRDLRDGHQMRLVGNRWRRLFWRAFGLTSILHFDRLPRGARAPRESRPPDGSGDAETLLEELQTRVAQFESVFAEAWRNQPGTRMTHPYFGTLSLRQSMKVITVHTRHHATFLRQSGTRVSGDAPIAKPAVAGGA